MKPNALLQIKLMTRYLAALPDIFPNKFHLDG